MKTITEKSLSMPESAYWECKPEIIEKLKVEGYYNSGAVFQDGYVTMNFKKVEVKE